MRNSISVPLRAEDIRPPSQLGRRVLDGKMVTGGALFALAAHLLVPGVIALVVALISAAGIGSNPNRAIPEDRVVQARFVKLGKPFDPRKIPNRKVPIKTTAPQPGVAVSKNQDPPKVKKPDAGPPPARAEENPLLHLGDRAQAFAEIAQKQEQEGDPQGIEDGTETTAKAGDIYRGQLMMFFRRGWTNDTLLGDTSHLTTRVSVEITADLHVGEHKISRPSGEARFDDSVERRISELHSLGTTLPEPPPEVRSQFAGRWIEINFTGSKPP